MKDKYCILRHISEHKIRASIRLFAVDLTVLQTAKLTGLNHHCVNRFIMVSVKVYMRRIYTTSDAARPMFGVVEVDESLFGRCRVKGKRIRRSYDKTTVVVIFKRFGQVYYGGCS